MPPEMLVQPRDFRQTLSRFASGVTVVTVRAPSGRPLGFTATAFSSVSLEPPLILVCATKGKPTHDALTATPAFAVNILAAGQNEVAMRFADPKVEDRFAGLDTRAGALGLPLLCGAVAHLECHRTAVFDGGDHAIVVGRVQHLCHTDAPPLLHFGGRFAEVQQDAAPPMGERLDWLVGAAW